MRRLSDPLFLPREPGRAERPCRCVSGGTLVRITAGIGLLALVAILLDQDQRLEEAAAVAKVEESYPDVRGVWEAKRLALETGQRHEVTGRLLLADRAWEAFYVVRDSAGEPRRATAEGGFYRPSVDTLHLGVDRRMVHGEEMAGLPALPFAFDAAGRGGVLDSASVPIDLRGDTLTLRFPGWGWMDFVRAEAPLR